MAICSDLKNHGLHWKEPGEDFHFSRERSIEITFYVSFTVYRKTVKIVFSIYPSQWTRLGGGSGTRKAGNMNLVQIVSI